MSCSPTCHDVGQGAEGCSSAQRGVMVRLCSLLAEGARRLDPSWQHDCAAVGADTQACARLQQLLPFIH